MSPVEDFDRLFATALGAQRLSPGVRLAARNALADLVHGFALAGRRFRCTVCAKSSSRWSKAMSGLRRAGDRQEVVPPR